MRNPRNDSPVGAEDSAKIFRPYRAELAENASTGWRPWLRSVAATAAKYTPPDVGETRYTKEAAMTSLLLLAALSLQATAPRGAVTGTVIVSGTSEPIADADI